MASRGGAGRGQGRNHILSREQQMQVGAYAEKLASELHDWKPAPRFEEYVRQNAYMRNIGAGLSHEALVKTRTDFLKSKDFRDHQETQKAFLQEYTGSPNDSEPPRIFREPGPWTPILILEVQDFCEQLFDMRPSARTIARARKLWECRKAQPKV